MSRIRFAIIEQRSQGQSDLKQYATFPILPQYPQVKFGISMSYSIGNMFRTQFLAPGLGRKPLFFWNSGALDVFLEQKMISLS